jgi:membrane peptidoglycan carboxypeptidase
VRSIHPLVVAVVLCVAALSVPFGNVDPPAEPDPPRASTLYYADGRTVLARVGVVDRAEVPLERVPSGVRRAFLTAVERDRTGWAALVPGSALARRYVRNAYGSDHPALVAVRLERRHGPDGILVRYLNTIYFGRGAYGIAAAARAWLGVPVERLTVAQGAFLAAVADDPTAEPDVLRDRWGRILAAMPTHGAVAYPEILREPSRAGRLGDPSGAVADRVEHELARNGVSAQRLRTGGLRVVTTLDERLHRPAVRAVERVLAGRPAGLCAALVAIEPGTGAVLAYYGGDRGSGFRDDAAVPRAPGAVFAPVVRAEALRQGVRLAEVEGGANGSPQETGGRTTDTPGTATPGRPSGTARDARGGAAEKDAPVPDPATTGSTLAERLDPTRVSALAHDLGISTRYAGAPALVDGPDGPTPGRTRADIGTGRYPVTPADLASVYATFATGGTRAERHLVGEVATADGTPVYRVATTTRRILSPPVALAATAPTRHTAPARYAAAASQDGEAWLAGYTPALAAVAWIGPDPSADLAVVAAT